MWGGVSQPVSCCWHVQAGCQAPPSQCDTFVNRLCTLNGTPLDSLYFSCFWDCSLHTWHWKDWQLQDRLGGCPRWHWINSANRREKHMWAQGDFLTIYQIGGIVYFLRISQGVHLWAPFTTSNRHVGRNMAEKIRRWLINGLATGFNTQIYNYLYFFHNHEHLFSNTNMLLSIFVNTANSFTLFLAWFPLLDRVINRVFHLAKILPVTLKRWFYTYLLTIAKQHIVGIFSSKLS